MVRLGEREIVICRLVGSRIGGDDGGPVAAGS